MDDPRVQPPPAGGSRSWVLTAHDQQRMEILENFPAVMKGLPLERCKCDRCETERRGPPPPRFIPDERMPPGVPLAIADPKLPNPIAVQLECPVCGKRWTYYAALVSEGRVLCPRGCTVSFYVGVDRAGGVEIGIEPQRGGIVGAQGSRRDLASDRTLSDWNADKEATYEWRFPDSPVQPNRKPKLDLSLTLAGLAELKFAMKAAGLSVEAMKRLLPRGPEEKTEEVPPDPDPPPSLRPERQFE